MINNYIIKNVLTAGAEYVDYAHYRRIVLSNALLYITALTLAFFALLNFNALHNVYVASLDSMAAIISVYGIWYFRRTHNLKRVIIIGTVNLFIFFIPFVLVNQNQSFGLIWTILFPLFAIQLNGRLHGLKYVVAFYALLWILAFQGIGVWQDGAWDLTSFMRLVVVSIVVTYIVYSNELSLEMTAKKLDTVRQQDQKHSQELKELSITDALTLLYNRRHFNETAPKLINRAYEEGLFCGFMIIDIDLFKDYNDFYGHQQGDETLKRVAQAIEKRLPRRDDCAFRLGGEEFAGMMQSNSEHFLYENAQAIIDDVRALEIVHSGSEEGIVTISIGLKVIEPAEMISLEKVYKLADEALYKAKANGRNQCVNS